MKLLKKALTIIGAVFVGLVVLGVILEMAGVAEEEAVSGSTQNVVQAPAAMAPSSMGGVPDNIRESIIARCRSQMEAIGGASMVRFCVDEDIAAYNALQTYGSEWRNVINRCRSQMLSIGGWSMVRFCADEDIAAERSLRGQ